jgi:hypothetical protein
VIYATMKPIIRRHAFPVLTTTSTHGRSPKGACIARRELVKRNPLSIYKPQRYHGSAARLLPQVVLVLLRTGGACWLPAAEGGLAAGAHKSVLLLIYAAALAMFVKDLASDWPASGLKKVGPVFGAGCSFSGRPQLKQWDGFGWAANWVRPDVILR